MFPIDNASAVGVLPTPAAAGTHKYFSGGNALTGTPGTIVEADWMNMVQEELLSVLSAASVSPSKTTYNQLTTAINALIAAAALANNSVTNAKLAQAPAGTLKGNLTGGTANEADNTLSAVVTAMGVPTIVAESLIEVGGYRVWSDGVIECWGYVDVTANTTSTVTLPYSHTTWVSPVSSGMGSLGNDPVGDSAIVGSPPTGFQIRNPNTHNVRAWWNSTGK
jgi:hypothetical protein